MLVRSFARSLARARAHNGAIFRSDGRRTLAGVNPRGVEEGGGRREGKRGRGMGRVTVSKLSRGDHSSPQQTSHPIPLPLHPVGYRNFVDSNNGNNDAATAAARR